MTLGLKSRLFLFSIALVAAVGAVSSVYLEFELRRWLEAKTADELVLLAKAYANSVENRVEERVDPAEFEQLTATQLWVFDANLEQVKGKRPLRASVRSAITQHKDSEAKVHVERMVDESLDSLYAFVPIENGGEQWLVVMRRGPQQIKMAVDRMRVFLLVTGAIALLMSSVLALFAVKILSGRLQSILARARAAIDDQRPADTSNRQELDVLHKNIDRLDLALEDMLKTLARERYRFEAVLEGIREAVFALNEAGEVVLTNRAGKKLLPKNKKYIGRSIAELIPNPELHEALNLALNGEAADLEFDIVRKKTRHILGQVTPHISEGGAVMVLHDVTRLRRLETMRRDFVANVSHELRTPVSVIRLNAEALRDGALRDEMNGPRFVDATLRHAERLSNLVSDLLDISRIESGQYENHPDWLNLPQVLGGLVSDMGPLAEKQDVILTLDEVVDREVMVDRKALDQVLTNLVQNAVKYADKPNIRVTVDAKVGKKGVVVRVSDEGPGIDVQHHPRVFERFYRVDAGRSKHMGGTGLGLAIVKHLVANMGGKVGLSANSPRGTVFWFSIPNHRESVESSTI